MKPFRVSCGYLYWAHESAAGDGNNPLAIRIMEACDAAKKPYVLFGDPVLVEEIASVAELYVGGRDTDIRAAGVLARAKRWLKENAK